MKRPQPLQGFKKLVTKHRPVIEEVVRETTSGGIVFRRDPKTNNVQILLIQDAKNRPNSQPLFRADRPSPLKLTSGPG